MEKNNNCIYCGRNPVPHFINWYFESINVLLTPLRKILLYNFASRYLKKKLRQLKLEYALFFLGKLFKIITFNDDIARCKVKRAQVLWEEALKRGIEMRELLLLGKPFDVYLAEKKYPSSFIPNPCLAGHRPRGSDSGSRQALQPKIKDKGSRMIFSGLPRPKDYDNSSLDWMDDKLILKKAFIKANLPIPQGGCAWNYIQAKRIFSRIEKPAIVKPRAGSRGRHSTTFVSSTGELKQAFKIAKQLCFWVVVEEQLKGPVYRATLINYELCGVLRGDPPQVKGNGRQAIQELIDVKNSQPCLGVEKIIADDIVKLFLFRQNLSLLSIPEIGQTIDLSEKIGVSYGGSSSEDFGICHKDNRELFINAAKVVGDPIVGFDFIIPDITRSWKEQKCGFIEANSLPFINLHHNPLLGSPRNVAAKVWEMIGW